MSNTDKGKETAWEYIQRLTPRIRELRGQFIEESIWIEYFIELELSLALFQQSDSNERQEFISNFLQGNAEITFNIKIELLYWILRERFASEEKMMALRENLHRIRTFRNVLAHSPLLLPEFIDSNLSTDKLSYWHIQKNKRMVKRQPCHISEADIERELEVLNKVKKEIGELYHVIDITASP